MSLISSTLLVINLLCQQTDNINMQILDKEFGKPVPYATIKALDGSFGIATSKNGYAAIIADSLLLGKQFVVSSVGYFTDTICILHLLKSNTAIIHLTSKPYEIPEFVVKGNRKQKELMVGVKKSATTGWVTKNKNISQVAIYFPNENHVGLIEEVSYFIRGMGFPEAPFRVRIYSSHIDSIFPDNDILPISLIVRANKKGWFAVDISEFQIPIPKKGFFVAFEWIMDSDDYFYNEGQFYGATLGLTHKHPYHHFWLFNLWNTTGWHNYSPFPTFLNPMIRAKLLLD
ncbi:MAG: hypothetical protein H0X62_17405 [Bacteroidetes bacterium]|nr:hypothetical protein [Bacteroidota bacterium]